ncbi:hypothetical protein KEM52_004603, partial [Ascosphaera acerosa]
MDFEWAHKPQLTSDTPFGAALRGSHAHAHAHAHALARARTHTHARPASSASAAKPRSLFDASLLTPEPPTLVSTTSVLASESAKRAAAAQAQAQAQARGHAQASGQPPQTPEHEHMDLDSSPGEKADDEVTPYKSRKHYALARTGRLEKRKDLFASYLPQTPGRGSIPRRVKEVSTDRIAKKRRPLAYASAYGSPYSHGYG